MQTRRLGKTDLELTVIGLGAWAIGGPWVYGWGPQNDKDSLATIKRALDAGINWIDTAAVYGLGRSEQVVGQAIKGRRDEVIVATKCGLVWDDVGRVSGRLKAKSVRAECEASLKRLGVERIDLYQIHWPDPDGDIEEGWSEVARLAEEGKLRYGGVSNFSVSQLRRAQTIMPIASLQPPYSMLKRDIETEILPFCKKEGIGVVAYSPMHSGLLTGKYDVATIAALPDDDWRKTKSLQFRPPKLAANLAFIEALKPVAKKAGLTLGQLAVAWVLKHPATTAAIVGMRKPSQVDDALPAAGAELDETVMAEIAALLAERERRLAAIG
ncbi:MAG: aldo/keto reductase [Myxococcales bacterium]|nr:MAG: aldo/keto reductase [Myxococcales bacterium]